MPDQEPNPITKLFPVAVWAYGWQVHGLLIGIALAVAFIAVVIASNLQVMSKAPDDWASKIQTRKWILFGLFMVGIGLSGARIITT